MDIVESAFRDLLSLSAADYLVQTIIFIISSAFADMLTKVRRAPFFMLIVNGAHKLHAAK